MKVGVVESLSLEVFKKCGDVTLRDVVGGRGGGGLMVGLGDLMVQVGSLALQVLQEH